MLNQRFPPILTTTTAQLIRAHCDSWEGQISVKHSIFISYRRDDSEGEAGRLFDDLVRVFGNDSVFMDVAGIAPGLDFRKAIDDNVAGCGVFLTIIGSQWATITGSDGKRRLDDDNDFVRLEIASALARNIAVIPVLVHDARMPHPEQLPDNIKDLAYRNSVEISHARWNSDVQLLIDALKQYVTTSTATENQPVHATVSVQLPPPVSNEPAPAARKSNLPLMIGGGIAALVILAVVGFAVFHKKPTPQPSPVPISGASNAGSAAAPAANSSAAGLAGSWHNTRVKKGGEGPIELHITGTDPHYRVEVLGGCPQGECSWGTQPVNFDGVQGVAVWSPRVTQQDIDTNRSALVTFRPMGETLNMHIQNTLTPQPGKTRRNNIDFDFVREH